MSVNVKDAFNVVGDGQADDTIALQAAFDAGDELYVPPGVYSHGPLNLNTPNTRIFGGRNAVLQYRSGLAGDNGITINAPGCAIEGLSVDGNAGNVNYVYNRHAILIQAPRCRIEKVDLYSAQSMGISLRENAVRARLIDCDVSNSGDFGIFANGNNTTVKPAYGLVRGCHVTNFGSRGNGAAGIGVRGPGWRIEANDVEQLVSAAGSLLCIETWDGGDGAIAIGNVVRAGAFAQFGISLTAPNCQGANNAVYGSTLYAIEVARAPGTRISQNHVFSPIGIGIAVNINAMPECCHRVVVNDNTVLGCTSSIGAIAVHGVGGQADSVKVIGNTIKGPSAGIYSRLNVNADISGNTISVEGVDKPAIDHWGDGASVLDNKMTMAPGVNYTRSMSVGGSDVVAAGNTMNGNAVTTNGLIVGGGCERVIARHNYMRGQTANAIYSASVSSTVTAFGNRAKSGWFTLQPNNVGADNKVL